MNDILYKTSPRLSIIGTFATGFIFNLLMAILSLQGAKGENSIWGYLFFAIFLVWSIAFLYYLVKIKILIITKSELIIKNYLFPKKRAVKLEEIKKIKQKVELSKLYFSDRFSASPYKFRNCKTNLELKSGETYELISVTEFEFSNLKELLVKIKRGEGKIKKPEKHFVLYLLENGLATIGFFIANLLNLGLMYALIQNSC